MRLHFCGTRGSTPAPGAEFVRYGGHTSCVAVAHDDRPPSLLIDAGTGVREASALLGGAPFRGVILLSHLHWDHTQGLPFFRAGDHPDAAVDLYVPAQDGEPEDVLARAMSPPHFPIRPGELRGRWRFAALEEGEHEVGGFHVLAREIPHKGGRTFGFRVDDGAAAFAYLSDHSPSSLGPGPDGFGEYHPAARALLDGVDLVVHDAQYTAEEFARLGHFGHACVEYALGLAEACGVPALALFHHDPSHTDADMDQIVERLRCAASTATVGAAMQGAHVDLVS